MAMQVHSYPWAGYSIIKFPRSERRRRAAAARPRVAAELPSRRRTAESQPSRRRVAAGLYNNMLEHTWVTMVWLSPPIIKSTAGYREILS